MTLLIRLSKIQTRVSLFLVLCGCLAFANFAQGESTSTTTQGAICSVEREVYVQPPTTGASTTLKRVWYAGPGLRRREIHLTSSKSDIIDWGRERYSDDNGRTWSPFTPLPGSEEHRQGEARLEGFPYALRYDPTS